jgi:hypothetical protein
MIYRITLMILVLAVSACSNLPFLKRAAPEPVLETPTALQPAIAPPAGSKTAAALDTTTISQKEAALTVKPDGSGDQKLGTTSVALGNVTEPGFWLRSALVKAPGKGRVETADGGNLQVDLIPGTGAAQLSLAAFRALKLPLTGLPQVTIFGQ